MLSCLYFFSCNHSNLLSMVHARCKRLLKPLVSLTYVVIYFNTYLQNLQLNVTVPIYNFIIILKQKPQGSFHSMGKGETQENTVGQNANLETIPDLQNLFQLDVSIL